MKYDIVIIGAGHNGLVAAAYLAKAGRTVLILEKRPVIGGAAAAEEIFEQCFIDTGAHDADELRMLFGAAHRLNGRSEKHAKAWTTNDGAFSQLRCRRNAPSFVVHALACFLNVVKSSACLKRIQR